MTTIFHTESGSTDEWLEVNDDGSLTHHVENAGWKMIRKGIGGSDKHYTAEEAKAKWPHYASKIDEALERRNK